MSIVIKQVTVEFKNHVRAVDQVDLTIPRGIYGLLGENGAGKTTLMRVLTTVLTPKEGEIWLDHIRYEPQQYETIKRKLGYLPQELNLYPGLSVRECLEYLGELSQIPKNICKKRIDFYLEKTGLLPHQKKKMRQLSGGMKRRVGLIQAMLGEPEFLIVDEPTTGLDPEERVRIRNLLVDFAKEMQANVVVRGLRAVTDFEYEIQIAQTNKVEYPDLETIFLTTSLQYSYLSSTIVKEFASYGGDISKFVPARFIDRIYEKYHISK